ncbi:MAG: type II toxin-antitoxin system PemK/MazF family toxin [Nanoarchaeota archaeon]|nr:type II toxin-antitoxin system PemK/MazF family toxin [Nanoarchaeota archaeon]
MEGLINYERGEVVIFRFPFSDTGEVKKRPSLVVAKLRGDHVILSQITSQPRPDPDLVELKLKDFQSGSISRDSFIRSSILFTIHKSKIDYKAGKLKPEKIKEVEKKLVEIFTR